MIFCDVLISVLYLVMNAVRSFVRWKIDIPLSRIERLFSRGSGNGGQNLHASNSRCQIKFDMNTAEWIPLKVRHAFLEQYGNFVSSKGVVIITREDTRSPSDNEKLAIKQLQSMLDKSEELSMVERQDIEYETEQERIKSSKTKSQIARYKDRMLKEKKLRSEVKRNRNRDWD